MVNPIQDGLYILSDSNLVLRWDSSADKLAVFDLSSSPSVGEIVESIFTIKKVPDHSSYQIKNVYQGKKLHYDYGSGNKIELGDGNAKEHMHYRWEFTPGSPGTFVIENVYDHSNTLRADLPGTGLYFDNWTLSRVGGVNASQDKVHGKTASGWRHVAHYLLQEGDKVIEGDYTDLWEELGETYGLSLGGSVSKPKPVP